MTVYDLRHRALRALATPAYAPFKMSAILPPDPADQAREEHRKTHWTATATRCYLTREPGRDRYGVVPPAYLSKAPNLVAHGRRYPASRTPLKYQTGSLIWQEADEAAAEHGGPAGWHAIVSLPPEAEHRWERLLVGFIDDMIVAKGAVADWAIHAVADEAGGWSVHPHAHLLLTCRRWRDDRQDRKGRIQPQWWSSKDQRTTLSSAWCQAAQITPPPFTAA